MTSSATEPCPVGKREFLPITDVHIGVISTSLGGHGADFCTPKGIGYDPTQNDAAHLLSRAPESGVIPTYQSLGFLAWDPGQKASPPGENDAVTLEKKLAAILRGTGDKGCGYEAQLESIYRFLMDPNPYASIELSSSGDAVPTGTDTVLLEQRADFLRPDSLVVTVLITDENDCSTKDFSKYYFSNLGRQSNGAPYHLPRARSECATNPESPCCSSCAEPTPPGCPSNDSDAECLKGPYTALEDPINLRCFDQKRRFGIDFLYPTARYVNGFTQSLLEARDGSTQPNPLFVGGRSPKLVLFAGIVGVPWQDTATDAESLAEGYAPGSAIDWSLILPDPTTGASPKDPLMVESIAPRSGTNPRTGDALAPPSSTSALANPINGHERTIPKQDDLQFACVYPRPMPEDCAITGCDCQNQDIDTNPLCQASDGTYSSTSRFAAARPGVRELEVLQGLGDQGVVASVCAATVTGTTQPTFGYKPALDAVLRSIRAHVPTP
jgi:hypothetical protein